MRARPDTPAFQALRRRAAYFLLPWPAFCFAQRRFCAAAMRARASALRTRFLRGRLPKDDAEALILAPPLLCSKARTFSRRLISSSTAAINSSRDIAFLFSLNEIFATYSGEHPATSSTIANAMEAYKPRNSFFFKFWTVTTGTWTNTSPHWSQKSCFCPSGDKS